MTKGAKGGGKGAGYQGTCWNCGKVGHKAAECDVWKVNEVAQDQQPCSSVGSVGGVWMISEVARQEPDEPPGLGRSWKTVPGRWRPKVRGSSGASASGVKITRGRFEALDICPVESDFSADSATAVVCSASAEITVDSAADESVCPRDWAEQFGTNPVKTGRELKLINATGGKINHYGSRKVAFQPEAAGARLLGIGFEVTDVKKPLMAVSRICEKGNIVQFGPDERQNFIQSIATGDKLYMTRRGNSYVLSGDLANTNPF